MRISITILIASSMIAYDKDYEYVEHLILSRAIERPPFSDRTLELADINIIADYVTRT
jgi:hypothetical protein